MAGGKGPQRVHALHGTPQPANAECPQCHGARPRAAAWWAEAEDLPTVRRAWEVRAGHRFGRRIILDTGKILLVGHVLS